MESAENRRDMVSKHATCTYWLHKFPYWVIDIFLAFLAATAQWTYFRQLKWQICQFISLLLFLFDLTWILDIQPTSMWQFVSWYKVSHPEILLKSCLLISPILNFYWLNSGKWKLHQHFALVMTWIPILNLLRKERPLLIFN